MHMACGAWCMALTSAVQLSRCIFTTRALGLGAKVEGLVAAWGCMGAACCSAVGPDNRKKSQTPSPHWRTHDASHQGCNGPERPDSATPTQGKCGTVRTLWFSPYLLASGTLQNCILYRIAKIARAARASGGALLILKE